MSLFCFVSGATSLGFHALIMCVYIYIYIYIMHFNTTLISLEFKFDLADMLLVTLYEASMAKYFGFMCKYHQVPCCFSNSTALVVIVLGFQCFQESFTTLNLPE